ncbi:MAG: tetratricopeptide repeat protein [Treponema sp.]
MASSGEAWIPDKKKLYERYQDYAPRLVILLDRLEEYLHSTIKISAVPSYKARVKSFDSLYRKLFKFPLLSETIDDLPVVSDLIGVRVICPFLQNLDEVERVLKENFTVIEIERKGADRTFYEFGYESTHVLVEIPEVFKIGLTLPQNLIFEIQIRTILQDAWAEVEHELVYKAEFSPFDVPLKRKLASINASLSLADIIFQEIRDYQHKLNTELDKRRNQFYASADTYTASLFQDETGSELEHTASVSTAHNTTTETIDDLILRAIEAHNRGDFKTAEAVYTEILAQPLHDLVRSIVYKHRGMAFFAQGNYDRACEDFNESIAHNAENFRSYYYAGIVLSLMKKNTEAIDAFSRSLAINGYQAHVYFRRALVYFQENQLVEALHDLDRAAALGLPVEEERKLRAAIAKKVDLV